MEKKLTNFKSGGNNEQEIELILQKIDSLETQDEQILERLDQKILALEKRDVFAVFETKMSPFKNQIEDL
jgi:hypothetical protein